MTLKISSSRALRPKTHYHTSPYDLCDMDGPMD